MIPQEKSRKNNVLLIPEHRFSSSQDQGHGGAAEADKDACADAQRELACGESRPGSTFAGVAAVFGSSGLCSGVGIRVPEKVDAVLLIIEGISGIAQVRGIGVGKEVQTIRGVGRRRIAAVLERQGIRQDRVALLQGVVLVKGQPFLTVVAVQVRDVIAAGFLIFFYAALPV